MIAPGICRQFVGNQPRGCAALFRKPLASAKQRRLAIECHSDFTLMYC